MDGTLPWGSIPMDPVPPNYEIEYVEEPIQKEEFVPQLNVPLQQEMVTGIRVSKRYKIISYAICSQTPWQVVPNW